MKLTKAKLKQLIKEELSKLSEKSKSEEEEFASWRDDPVGTAVKHLTKDKPREKEEMDEELNEAPSGYRGYSEPNLNELAGVLANAMALDLISKGATFEAASRTQLN